MAKNNNRNAQGAGSIRQRPDGRWEARYTVGRDSGTGKQIQRSIYGKTQKEVLKKLQQVSVDIENGVYIEPEKLTVSQWLDIWLDEYTGNLKPLTITSYKAQCNNHIKPGIGAVKLSTLTPAAIQKMYNKLHKENGLSAKTVKNIHGVLHKALEQAVKIGYLRFNPASNCTLPRVYKKEIKPLDDEMIKAFMKAVEVDRFKTLYIVTLFTGMRQGEVLGLCWNCVDFENGTIIINKQLQREMTKGAKYYFAPLKNDKARIITPAPFVMKQLRELKSTQTAQRLQAGQTWGMNDEINNDLVFTDELGCHLAHRTVYKHYKAIVKSIGIPEARFHDLRHTFAVTALQNGDDIKTVQETLGHHTAAFTLDVYGHVSERMKKESAERMEQFIKSI